MSSVTFDTLAYAKRLKKVGFTEAQAEAQAEAQKEMLSEVLETTLATKTDIDRLDKQIVVLKWMMGVMLAGVVSLVGRSRYRVEQNSNKLLYNVTSYPQWEGESINK